MHALLEEGAERELLYRQRFMRKKKRKSREVRKEIEEREIVDDRNEVNLRELSIRQHHWHCSLSIVVWEKKSCEIYLNELTKLCISSQKGAVRLGILWYTTNARKSPSWTFFKLRQHEKQLPKKKKKKNDKHSQLTICYQPPSVTRKEFFQHDLDRF